MEWLYWRETPLKVLPPKTFEGWRKRGVIPRDLWRREKGRHNGRVLVMPDVFTLKWINEKKAELERHRLLQHRLK